MASNDPTLTERGRDVMVLALIGLVATNNISSGVGPIQGAANLVVAILAIAIAARILGWTTRVRRAVSRGDVDGE